MTDIVDGQHQAHLGANLRAFYQHVVEEKLPERLRSLLDALDRREMESRLPPANLGADDADAAANMSEWDFLAKVRRVAARWISQGHVTFDHQGCIGLEMILTPNVGPAAETNRMSFSMVETAKGRTALICVADKDSIAAVLPEFQALRAAIRAPEWDLTDAAHPRM